MVTIFLVLAVLALFLLMIAVTTSSPVEANTKIQHFSCGSYGTFGFHCDPALYPLSSYALIGNKSEIFPIANPNPTYVPGVAGNAIELQAPYREYIEIKDKHLPYDYDNFSVSFWVKQILDPNAQQAQIISHINSEMKGGWFFNSVYDANNNYVQFNVFDRLQNSSESAEIPVSNTTFTHIIGTFNGSAVTIYRNGSLYDVKRFEGGLDVSPDPKIPIHIGSASYCDSCEGWSGIIDEVMLLNGTISKDQANLLYSESLSGNRSFEKDKVHENAELVGYWRFDGNLEDGSGGKNNATVFTPIGSIVFSPDGRMFLSEKDTGKIMIMENNSLLPTPFASIDGVYVNWEQGLLGLAIDPLFQDNHFVYAYYTTINNETAEPINRVVRFTDKNNTATEMKILLDNVTASRGYHSGGALAFGPDDKLYITVGDATQHIFAQSISTPLGKVLRIERDGSIPSDNPYPDSPVYTLGHRNMYGIAFDDNGNGIILENGDVLYDEINVLKKGGNYGFPVYQPANQPPELSNSTIDIKPVRSYWNTIAPTQGIFYRGTQFPYLQGSFIFGTYTGKLYSVTLNNDTKKMDSESHILLKNYPFEPVISVAESPDGDLYFGGFHIYKLTSLNLNNRVQDFFPVRVEMPDYLTVKQLQFNPVQRFVYLDVSTGGVPGYENDRTLDNTTVTPAESYDKFSISNTSLLNVTVPNSLLANVSAVNVSQSGDEYPTEFSIFSNQTDNSTKVSIPVKQGLNGRITIYGENNYNPIGE